jgi:hypothetical protein
MEDTKMMTAPCGLDCFNCEVNERNITDALREMLSAKFGIPPAKVQCKGCRGQKGDRLGLPQCETYACAMERDIDFCFECNEFPCPKLQPARDGADRYPHNMKLYNLCRIKTVGIDVWAKETPDIRRRYFTGTFIIGCGPVVNE